MGRDHAPWVIVPRTRYAHAVELDARVCAYGNGATVDVFHAG